MFPDPYNTQGIRLTDASDCVGSTDCVNGVGSAYWRRINNHVGGDTMLIVLGLDRTRGGAGPTLFQYNKVTDAVTNFGPLFDSTSPLSWATGDMWYFSATQPTKLYLNDGPRLLRYDVLAKTFETVLDVSTQPAPIGPNTIIWKMHSSNDDRVHSATLKDAATLADLGCVAYLEDAKQFFYVPQLGFLYDACQIDKSGRWLLMKEKLSASTPDVDNRMIDLTTGVETDLLDQNGAGGHSDNGFGYMVAADNWNSLPNAIRLWKFGTSPLGPGTVVYDDPQELPQSVQHLSHANANPTLPPEQQYACGSGADSTNGPRVNEVVCFLLDGSFQVLVVAPVMTDMNATGGGDAYSKLPKGNLDVTGQYFIWTSNVGTSRLDAFLVKVPAHVLTNLRDTMPPTVSITAPLSGITVSGLITASATATDNVGVTPSPITSSNVAQVTVAWDPNAEPDLAGYKLYYGTSSRSYQFSADVGTRTSSTLSGLLEGQIYYFAVTAYNFSGYESDFSNEMTRAVADVTPPTVSITAPAAGSTVAGTVTVSASATDNVGVVGVQFTLDGVNFGAEVTSAPYNLSWNTTNAANGPHTLTAVARDATGNVTTSTVVSVTVANASVSITAPLNFAQLTNLTEVTVHAASGIGLSSIEIYSDSTLLTTVSCIGNSCSDNVNWDTNGLATGFHFLYAVATDTFGNSSSSMPIIVFK